MSESERYNHFLEELQNGPTDTQKQNKTEAHYTICDKMSNTGDTSIIEYLFDQGKCGDICRKGNSFYYLVLLLHLII